VIPSSKRRKIEERTTEQWIDEGSVRRGGDARRREPRHPGDAGHRSGATKPLDPEIAANWSTRSASSVDARLSERLAQASEALDRERFQEARRIASSIAKEAPTVAAAHEVVGLANYRLGQYKQALRALRPRRTCTPTRRCCR
jgi:hypothetical protein